MLYLKRNPLTHPSNLTAGLIAIILGLILLRFFAVGWNLVVANSNSNAGDQGEILQLGLDFKEHGTLTEGKRSPLYPVLLYPFAQRTWSYFTWAKIVSLVAGGLAVILVFLLGKRLGHPEAAILAALLLSINFEFLYHTSTALVEGLLVLTFWVGWYYVGHALITRYQTHYWILAGIFSGLAYLSKGTGNFLIIAGGLTALILYWPHPVNLLKSLFIFGLSFLITASPLLLYNYVFFGSPTHNFSTAYAMWMDKWRQSWVEDVTTLPTFSTYIAEHTYQDIVARLRDGIQELWIPFWQTIIPLPSKPIENIIFSAWGWLAIFIVGLILGFYYKTELIHYLQKSGQTLLFSSFILFFVYLLFAWYTKIVIGARFFLPLLPIMYFYFGLLFWFIFTRFITFSSRFGNNQLFRQRTITQWMHFGFWVLVGGWLVWTTLPELRNLQNPFQTDVENNIDTEHVLSWLTAGEPDGAHVVWGPSHSLPYWKYSDQLNIHLLPVTLKSLPQITAYLLQTDVDYIILDELMVRRYKERFRDHIAYQSGRLEILQPIEDWDLAYVYKGYPCDWCVFRIQTKQDFVPVADVQLNHQIQLLGYELVDQQITPAQTASVWLYWQSSTPIENNYTVFTQVVGGGQLQAQVDRQPLHALWPTSQWFPQTTIADRFDIPIPDHTPPGAYQIYVGMYDLETGQRLAMFNQGEPVHDNAFIIEGLSIIPAE